MNWEDEAFLLSKRKFRENANIINVFTSTRGKVSGIVYGGNSRKIRNYLQIGNKIHVIFNSKNENRIGYLKTELIEPISPKYFNDKKKISCLLSLTSLLNLLLPEGQNYNHIYSSIDKLIKNFDSNNWVVFYIYWELYLIKELGYGINLKNLVKNLDSKDNLIKVKIYNDNYLVPYFLTNNEFPNIITDDIVVKSLRFIRLLMSNKFFMPNNIIFPKSRVLLENYFN
jgi:DNA repair protein RecO (recombination protein O)